MFTSALPASPFRHQHVTSRLWQLLCFVERNFSAYMIVRTIQQCQIPLVCICYWKSYYLKDKSFWPLGNTWRQFILIESFILRYFWRKKVIFIKELRIKYTYFILNSGHINVIKTVIISIWKNHLTTSHIINKLLMCLDV